MHLLLNFLKKFSHILLLGMVFIIPFFQGITEAKEQNIEVVSEVQLHVFLLIGGINMEGRGEITESDEKVVDDALIWDPQYSVWTQVRVPYGQYSPFLSKRNREYAYWGKLNCGPSFVRTYKISNPDAHIGIICAPRNHMTIHNWKPGQDPSHHPFFNTVVDVTRKAIGEMRATGYSKKVSPVLKGILWHDGEQHYENELDEYFDLFPKIMRNLRNELSGGKSLPIVFGQLCDGYESFNERIIKQTAVIPNSACVRTVGLSSSNNFTFDSESYRELGKRYAKEMMQLLENPLRQNSVSVIPTKELSNDWIIKSPSGKPYPIHWGFPPRTKIQYGYTLPDGYGDGGKSTLEWINRNKAKDAQ